jgi:hypothetical protein
MLQSLVCFSLSVIHGPMVLVLVWRRGKCCCASGLDAGVDGTEGHLVMLRRLWLMGSEGMKGYLEMMEV